MEHYITLFDSNFLPQGLALHESLKHHAGLFKLWVLCMDEKAEEVLKTLDKVTICPVSLSEIETPELLAVKAERTRAEYCWTLTPQTPKIVFDRDQRAERVTYLDADMFFLKKPRPIFEEFEISGKSVLITEHAYYSEYDLSASSGQYCVQFMTFVRDRSDIVCNWWAEKCIEWCYARFEDDKFGDQKYLDDWPERFPNDVHVLQKKDSLLAPWNAKRFPYSGAIAWHFHGLRLLSHNRVKLYAHYSIPTCTVQYIYKPYVVLLKKYMDETGLEIVQGHLDSPMQHFWRQTQEFLLSLLKIYDAVNKQKVIRIEDR